MKKKRKRKLYLYLEPQEDEFQDLGEEFDDEDDEDDQEPDRPEEEPDHEEPKDEKEPKDDEEPEETPEGPEPEELPDELPAELPEEAAEEAAVEGAGETAAETAGEAAALAAEGAATEELVAEEVSTGIATGGIKPLIELIIAIVIIAYAIIVMVGIIIIVLINGIAQIPGSASTICPPGTIATPAAPSGPTTSVSISGTGSAIAGTGHNWKSTVMTDFGGPSECQPVAGPYPGTCTMNKKGPFYFATGWHSNPNVPAELRPPKFKFGTKLIFKYNGRTAIGVFADLGPGATGDGRYLDLGYNLAQYLGFPGKASAQWDFVNSGDKIASADDTVAVLGATTPTTIVIDPGHVSDSKMDNNGNGLDWGNTGAEGNGIKERDEVVKIAKSLGDKLKAQGYNIVYTKDVTAKNAGELKVTNKDRATIANNAHASLFLRIHNDGSGSNSSEGYFFLYPDKTGSINNKGKVTGPPVSVQQQSKIAADDLDAAISSANIGLKNGGVRKESSNGGNADNGGLLAGSVMSNVPVTLIEVGNLDSTSDANWLKGSGNIDKLTTAMASGVNKYAPTTGATSSSPAAPATAAGTGITGISFPGTTGATCTTPPVTPSAPAGTLVAQFMTKACELKNSSSAWHTAASAMGVDYTDCWGYVASSLHFSIDVGVKHATRAKDAPDYLHGLNASRYQVLSFSTRTLQPGDMMFATTGGHSHAALFVGSNFCGCGSGRYTKMDASLGGHEPRCGTVNSGFFSKIVRIIN